MIPKQGKIYINGRLQDCRYDRNEPYGVDCGEQKVQWWDIKHEWYFYQPTRTGKLRMLYAIVKILCNMVFNKSKKVKVTISDYTEITRIANIRLAFDPPETGSV